MKNSTSISEESFKTYLLEDETRNYVPLEQVRHRLEFVTSVLENFEPPPSSGHFLLISKNNQGESWFHLQKAVVNIGRSKKADLTLKNDAISRFHCRIENNNNHWEIIDMDSKNNLYVNGREYKHRILCNGDIIKIGAFNIVYMKS